MTPDTPHGRGGRRPAGWFSRLFGFRPSVDAAPFVVPNWWALDGEAVLARLPWGMLGLTICYDLRFPALYRTLAQAGAQYLAVPAAFTRVTGEAHWTTLLRARAIEAQCFVFAAGQGGRHENGRETYGHSLIISPWGEILIEGGSDPGVFAAEIDAGAVAQARSRVPSLTHDRPFRAAAPATG